MVLLKNKRNAFGIIFLIALLLLALCGCHNSDENYDAAQMDFSQNIQDEWNSSKDKNQPEFLNLLDEKSSFNCISTDYVSDGYYVVNVQVTSSDISNDLKEYKKQITGKKVDTKQMNKKLCELINNAQSKTTNQTVDIIVDDDNNVRVQFNDDFVNAMFGYAYIEGMQAFLSE